MARVRIKKLREFSEFEACIKIQKEVWRHPDIDITPTHQFCISAEMGAVILGAFVDGEMAGFVYSFPAVRQGKLHLHSHLLAVLPRYQGLGLGKKLKRAQRDEALRAGYNLVTWTFDPLQTRNANLNLQALGAMSRTYLANFYGMTPSLCIGPGIPTDRLLIEWPIQNKGAAAKTKRKNGKGRMDFDVERLPKALEREATPEDESGFYAPGRLHLRIMEPTILVEVPKDVHALKDRPDLIAAWQTSLRKAMTNYFAAGYRAGHFLFDDRCFYVLFSKRSLP